MSLEQLHQSPKTHYLPSSILFFSRFNQNRLKDAEKIYAIFRGNKAATHADETEKVVPLYQWKRQHQELKKTETFHLHAVKATEVLNANKKSKSEKVEFSIKYFFNQDELLKALMEKRITALFIEEHAYEDLWEMYKYANQDILAHCEILKIKETKNDHDIVKVIKSRLAKQIDQLSIEK